MKLTTKVLAILSAVALLAACENPSTKTSDVNGNGAGNTGTSNGESHELVPGIGDRVYFDTDSSVVNAEGQATLQKQSEWLKKSSTNVTVEGHCDERGTREYNLALGERRANAAKNYLVSLGVPASRIQTISYGKERPAVVGSDESAWSQNRRAVTVVSQ